MLIWHYIIHINSYSFIISTFPWWHFQTEAWDQGCNTCPCLCAQNNANLSFGHQKWHNRYIALQNVEDRKNHQSGRPNNRFRALERHESHRDMLVIHKLVQARFAVALQKYHNSCYFNVCRSWVKLPFQYLHLKNMTREQWTHSWMWLSATSRELQIDQTGAKTLLTECWSKENSRNFMNMSWTWMVMNGHEWSWMVMNHDELFSEKPKRSRAKRSCSPKRASTHLRRKLRH